LNQSLATELVCVLRYRQHHFAATGLSAQPVADEFLEHANEEQQHADLLSARIVQLGGVPDMNPQTLTGRAHSQYVTAHELRSMIEENLVAERIAIAAYTEIITWLGDGDPLPGASSRRSWPPRRSTPRTCSPSSNRAERGPGAGGRPR